jgi:hypothetical protein
MRRPNRGPEYKPRKCPACKLTFVPLDENPANAKRQRFCGKHCKDRFHRAGGMTYDRLMEVVARKVRDTLAKDPTFAAELRERFQQPILSAAEIRTLARDEIRQAFERQDSQLRERLMESPKPN